MAWFQVHKLLWLTPHKLLVMIIMCPLLFSSSHAKPCKCSSSDQDQRDNIAISTTSDQMLGYFFPGNSSNNNTWGQFNLSASGNRRLIFPWPFRLWEKSGDDGKSLQEAAFTVSFTISIYQSDNQQQQKAGSLFFAILPAYILTYPVIPPPPDSLNPFSSSRTIPDSSYISINISSTDKAYISNGTGFGSYPLGVFNSTGAFDYNCNSIWIEISIQPPENSTPMSNYTVWVEYDTGRQQLLVYVIDEGKPKPGTPVATMPGAISNMTSPYSSYFSFFSSTGQLSLLHTCNSTVEVLPDISEPRGKLSAIGIVFVVLGSSVAMGALVAATVYCYFNSKYRIWKKDLDQLAKSMQQLPGVPIQVNFRDIQRATNNFHETTKLGRGGYGAVYRCRIPAPVRGEFLEVAVKKFTRKDNRRYDDFLAEVSVINRLRHKNIVPLIGWSYNKGEPLLIYEYMPNGSLDQHLFRRGGDQQQRSPISQWGTRYNIVMDVATGLQYVHHEYEPMVLHRDIKASNIMIDSTFQGRLGDFGLACTVDMGKNSYTDLGDPRGTPGFIALEYVLSGRATRKTDIFAFGVLILEIITGKPPLGEYAGFNHITDWVWHLHREGKILDAVDSVLTTEHFDSSDAKRLLLLGLACSGPNPSERPSMMEALQVITKLAPSPDVPLEKPRFVWPPEECNSTSSYFRTATSSLERSSTCVVEMAARGHASFENAVNSLHRRPLTGGHSQGETQFSVYHTARGDACEKDSS